MKTTAISETNTKNMHTYDQEIRNLQKEKETLQEELAKLEKQAAVYNKAINEENKECSDLCCKGLSAFGLFNAGFILSRFDGSHVFGNILLLIAFMLIGSIAVWSIRYEQTSVTRFPDPNVGIKQTKQKIISLDQKIMAMEKGKKRAMRKAERARNKMLSIAKNKYWDCDNCGAKGLDTDICPYCGSARKRIIYIHTANDGL